MRSALINEVTLIVENIIVADPSVDPAPSGYLLVDVSNEKVEIGWIYDPNTGTFSNPNPPQTDVQVSSIEIIGSTTDVMV